MNSSHIKALVNMNFISNIRKKYHTGRYRVVKKLLKSEGRNLLDVGCGKPCRVMEDGSFLHYLGYGSGIDIYDMEIPFDFKVGSITDIPYPDNSFETVTALEVIEHIEDYRKAIEEMKRVLKPGGSLIITTPYNGPLFKISWNLWVKVIAREWDETHVVEFTKMEWIILLSEYFKVEEVVDYLIDIIIKVRKTV